MESGDWEDHLGGPDEDVIEESSWDGVDIIEQSRERQADYVFQKMQEEDIREKRRKEIVLMKTPTERQKEIFSWLRKSKFSDSSPNCFCIDDSCLLKSPDGCEIKAVSWLLNENFDDNLLIDGYRVMLGYRQSYDPQEYESVEKIEFKKVTTEVLPEALEKDKKKKSNSAESNPVEDINKFDDDIPF